MPIYQKTTPREDTKKKRPLAPEDIAFLNGLQHELNTQDTMGNRDPRFWVIRQEMTEPCSEEDADETVVWSDGAAAVVARDLPSFMEYLKEELGDKFEYRPDPTDRKPKCYEMSVRSAGDDDRCDCRAYGPDDAISCLREAGYRDYGLRYQKITQEIVQDRLFLTHKACEDHLRKYHYNYKANAHAYAMTAVRSPEVETLVDLLQSVDWKSLLEAQEDESHG